MITDRNNGLRKTCLRRWISPALIALGAVVCAGTQVAAQNDIEGVSVEVYYISDENDATDTDGGILQTGSYTYRVFVDLLPCSRLRALYGDVNHAFSFSSTEVFFNNEDRGKTYGFEIDEGRIDENTVAIDSWLTLGAATRAHFGVLKSEDPDSSVVGGVNNDGGSSGIAGGLLSNTDELMGIPLVEKDGLFERVDTLFDDLVTAGENPSTILDDASAGSSFSSNAMTLLIAEGITGTEENNKVLVAQFTTAGDLIYKFNLEVINCDGVVVKYVANADTLLAGEFYSPYLSYPPQCGCMDPDYLEFDPVAVCDDGSCSTVAIFGCADTLACNFDPAVNLNIQELCCILPDNCEGLDPDLICPGFVGIGEAESAVPLVLFPNPVDNVVHIRSAALVNRTIVSDLSGSEVLDLRPGQSAFAIDCSALPAGVYFLRAYLEDGTAGITKLVIY